MRTLIILFALAVGLQAAERRNWHGLTQQEREAKRKELRQRLDNHLERLRNKQSKGALTPDEARRLRHLETIAKRFVT